MQAGGVTIAATYIIWIHVEEEEGVFKWSGNRDIRAFVEACQQAGLSVMLRIGPFVHGECRNGGLPDWLYGRGIKVRSNDPRYLFYVQRFFAEIGEQVEGLLFKDGGPVIGVQIENEYMHAGAPWEVTFKQGREWVPAGSDGPEHLEVLKQIAVKAGLEVPVYSCTGWGGAAVPEQGFLPMQSAYAFTPWELDPWHEQAPTREFLFCDRHAGPRFTGEVSYDVTRYPYAYGELGGGNQITYNHRPVVPPECVQAMAVVALGSGTNLLGYYMYHGGSNPVGKHAYLNEFTTPRISYDFQAPIREYGQIGASYHRLRVLHLFLREFGALLAPMTVSLPEESGAITPENNEALRYAVRSKDGAGFLFLNNYQDHVAMHDQEGIHLQLELPGASLSLPRGEGLTLRKDASAILPFNLRLAREVLLKYATAQLITSVEEPERTAYVFFAPQGMRAEFALDRSTYERIDVTAGTLEEDNECSYITAEPGFHCHIDITGRYGIRLRLLVLTQAQAYSCWKVHVGGQERLVLSQALILSQADDLCLSWQGQPSTDLAIYPPLTEDVVCSRGAVTVSATGSFTCYTIALPEHVVELAIEQPCAETLHIKVPANALDGVHDVFLHVDYFGDMGNAYLDGHLVSDHFANGSPWEIGLKRFLAPGMERELVVHFSPFQQDAAHLRYFTGKSVPLAREGGMIPVEVYEITTIPEYHAMLTLRGKGS